MLSVGMLIKKAMKGHVDLLGPAKSVADELTGIPSFETPDYSEILSEELAMIKKMKKIFLMVGGSAVQKFGTELEEHQQILMSVSDLLIEIYLAESGILRAKKNVVRYGEEAMKEQIAMAQLYLYHAVDLIHQNSKEAIVSFAEGDEQRMMLMGLKRFTKYLNQPNIIKLRNIIADKVVATNTYPF